MYDSKEIALLIDILKIFKHYDDNTINGLTSKLSDTTFVLNVHKILLETSGIQKQIQKTTLKEKKPVKKPNSFGQYLETISEYDKKKSELLLGLYNGLLKKELLPTLRDIKNYLADVGLPQINPKSRDTAIVPFMKIIATLDTDNIVEKINIMNEKYKNDDRSLEGWSKIILKKDKNSPN
jgi:hypothetical protein